MLLPALLACGRDAGARAGQAGERADSGIEAGRTTDRGRPEQALAPITVEGDDGVRVELPSAARRVISLIPGSTDAILALGGAECLVARTRYDEDPRLAHLPSLQDALTPSIEWILQQRPDLVIAWPDRQTRSVVQRLRDLGIPVYASNVETIDDTRRAIAALGLLIGREAAADSILSALDSTVARVRRATARLPRVRVLYLIGIDPPMAAGAGTFVDDMISIAGGDNILRDAVTRWPPVSLEQIVARQPDVMLVAVGSSRAAVLEKLRAMPGMASVRAVREGRVRVLDASLFNRPGPTIIGALEALERAIHPDIASS